MKKIWHLLRTHLRSDFNWQLYVCIGLFLATAISLNYTFDIENSVIDRSTGRPIRILWYFFFYSISYFGAALMTFGFTGTMRNFGKRKFWLMSLTGLFILSCNVGFPYMTRLIRSVHSDYQVYSWLYRVGNNTINFAITALPLLVFSRFVEERREYFGVNRQHIDLRPYFQILLLIVPLIAIASFEDGFRNYYPTYKPNKAAEVLGWPDFVPPLLYELAYGMDFFNVELMFRGLLVVGVSQVIGKEAVLPMVCTYCFLHFGKPVGEAISSVFGGYLLGVVALYTRNIWGGVMVHIGLAWMMELAAALQRAFN